MKSSPEHNQSNITQPDNKSRYDSNYLKWKRWGIPNEFGTLKKTQRAYFFAEIKRSQCEFPPGSRVLEIGFGNGSFLTFSKEQGWETYGTELNKNLVEIATGHGFEAKHNDNLTIFNDNYFDLIVAFDVLEHLPHDGIEQLMKQVKRTLKPKGYFMARFPNGDSPFGLFHQNRDVTHVTTIGTGKIFYYAAHSGMSVIYAGGEAEPLLGTSIPHFLHRLIALPTKRILGFLTNIIFFPRSNMAFYSANLTVIYQKS